jgi:spore germination cell wall hydrolase CwlJ-like protein
MKGGKYVDQIIEIKKAIAACVAMMLIFSFTMDLRHNHIVNQYEEKDAINQERIIELEDQLTTLQEETTKLEDQLTESRQENEEIKRRMSYLKSYKAMEGVVAAESKGQPLEGQMAVAQTILDRATQSNMTVMEVINAPSQYAKPRPERVDDSVKLAVAKVMQDGERVFDDGVWSFHSDKVNPWWAANKVYRGKIGNHLFYN